MWSQFDKPVLALIKTVEQQLAQNGGLEASLPFDSLQLSISLEQQSSPKLVSWNATVREGATQVYNIGCNYPEPLTSKNEG